ncbi:16S rRNA (cytidine(1402)-2'-O)-methyltransferase [Glaciimonas sp. CA11.2]|uniref:16S rRNA (cytidine(1402)-2'-O)-methyltransferase n=1 Tax=unclassified Glaciimonas TaxID=2644401 RepID=UPI002AB3398F|nr:MULTISPECIES: 16S rRNA (cytidine(1402)-2'-O)-methyltransferase [unclassified Glaciimonas]MDY7546289.1 16S rRNA (cytidine(1402)-2'-O)-methyltransferase [Glaciimonas sp. CA11.2]MEB0010762.1 16S rRNA (cytidine(1402)-2'-O)-methyltransferase [Glaciimonas sp. Cout2]MEB0082102.1 16S rRNA (cytidine(1402)-2'-O)-methyltransferase [Glaciimonas sp. Gout2]MEB0163064.1 16S rRNA (cytidine(1402)-2'-O)-methyltransferase [Glaciimonas sp. CA11.2]
MTEHSASNLLTLPILSEVSLQTYPLSTLYVLATPIGNVCDISLRALHVLSLVDAVACEDTRNTAHLLNRYGISKPLLAAHQHNEHEAAEKIVARLQAGERIALVSDAGTPGVSDPGARIVDAVIKAGLRALPLPGPSAAITALSVSGLLHDQFQFVGFLPSKTRQRETVLASLANVAATLVLYEAPHRIIETVDALVQAFGPVRQIVLARELTKLFETIHRCPLGDAPTWLAADPMRQKGEFVILIDSPPVAVDDGAEGDRILKILLAELSVKQAASLAAQISGQKKNALYDRALVLKGAQEKGAQEAEL